MWQQFIVDVTEIGNIFEPIESQGNVAIAFQVKWKNLLLYIKHFLRNLTVKRFVKTSNVLFFLLMVHVCNRHLY